MHVNDGSSCRNETRASVATGNRPFVMSRLCLSEVGVGSCRPAAAHWLRPSETAEQSGKVQQNAWCNYIKHEFGVNLL